QRLLRGFRGAHGDPRLPAAGLPAGRIGDGDDPAVLAHHRHRCADRNQELRRLGVKRRLPCLQRDLHWFRVEACGERSPGVRNEDVQAAELGLDGLELVYYALHMSMGKPVRERQPEMWVATTNFPTPRVTHSIRD